MQKYIKTQLEEWKRNEYNAETVLMLEDALQSENPKEYIEEIVSNGYEGSYSVLAELYPEYAERFLKELTDMEKELEEQIEEEIVVECNVCGEYKHYEETNWGEEDDEGNGYNDLVCYECLPGYLEN